VVLILVAAGIIGGSFALSSFAERTIPAYSGDLAGFSYGGAFTISEADMSDGVSSAIEPYTLDIVQDIRFDFSPPNWAELSAVVWGTEARISGRIELENGVVKVYVQRLGDVPLYIAGGIISGGINRGIEELFERANFRLDVLDVRENGLRLRAD
jgi:hypothetical protein